LEWLTYPVWAILLSTLIVAHLAPNWCRRWEFVPFLLGMVFLGLPHGALDHLVPLRLRCCPPTLRYMVLFILAYGGMAALYLLFWRWSPGAALAVFLLLSWLHWGQGDADFLTRFAGQPPPASQAGRLLIWAVRGGLPILLPALAFPRVFTQVAAGIVGWYGQASGWRIGQGTQLAGLMILGLFAVIYLWQSWRLSRTVFLRDFGEISLLTVYFLTVPPIFAVGLYFCVWHSARHIARLIMLEPAHGISWEKRLARNAWQAVPMTAAALVMLGGIYFWQRRVAVSAGDFVFLYLSLIAALTFPHFLLVLWMDREEPRKNCGDPVLVSGRSSEIGDGF